MPVLGQLGIHVEYSGLSWPAMAAEEPPAGRRQVVVHLVPSGLHLCMHAGCSMCLAAAAAGAPGQRHLNMPAVVHAAGVPIDTLQSQTAWGRCNSGWQAAGSAAVSSGGA